MLLSSHSEEGVQPISNKQEKSNLHGGLDANNDDDNYDNNNNNEEYKDEEIQRLADELDRVHEEYTDTLQKLEESMAMVKLARDSETEMREQLRAREDEVEILARELECLQMEINKKDKHVIEAAKEPYSVKESSNNHDVADNDNKSDSKESQSATHNDLNASFTSSSTSTSTLSSSAEGQLPSLNEDEVKDIAEIMALEQQRQLRKLQPDTLVNSPIEETPTSNEYKSSLNDNEEEDERKDEEIQKPIKLLSNEAVESNSPPPMKAPSQSKERRVRSSLSSSEPE